MIGVDIEDNSRFEKFTEEKLKRIFDDSELAYCNKFKDRLPHLTGHWCAKEAVIKALQTNTISYKDVVISHDGDVPVVDLNLEKNKKLCEILQKKHKKSVKISISHEKNKSIAVAILEND